MNSITFPSGSFTLKPVATILSLLEGLPVLRSMPQNSFHGLQHRLW